jgi:hypothetical protein
MLWQNILGFDLDYPLSEYGFSTRLEIENNWTFNFAQDAIIEYKKFMYLATISDEMVSPSEIVDIVWHQHLIFTQSYENLCNILGKKIEHIPSTHNRSDATKFKLAKEHIQKLYNEHFGEQPAVYWEYPDIYSPLLLEKSRFHVNRIIEAGVILFFPLLLIAYAILKPVYVNINNPYFVIGYMIFSLLLFAVLRLYNYSKFTAFMNSWERKSFMLNLSPSELIYLKNNKIKDVIDGVINQFVRQDRIKISGKKLSVDNMCIIESPAELCVFETIKEHEKMTYPALLKHLVTKPVFNKTVQAMEGYKERVSKSVFFIRLFIVNFGMLSIGLLLGIVRIMTGATRDKPVVFITLIVLGYLIAMSVFLYRLKGKMGSHIIIQFYMENRPASNDWEWQYFLLGPAVFVPVFIPLVTTPIVSSGTDSGSSGGCSAGCGSSCGGGCGGCGGD